MVVERLLGGFGIIDLHVRVAIHNSVGLSILTQRNLTEVWGGICFISAFPPPPGLNVVGVVCFLFNLGFGQCRSTLRLGEGWGTLWKNLS